MSETTTVKRFPVNGPRQPVYDFMRSLGFSMAKHSDKKWTSADGIEVHIYGAGSMAHISVNGVQHDECELDNLAERIDAIRH